MQPTTSPLVTYDFKGSWGFDCNTPLTAAKAKELAQTPLPPLPVTATCPNPEPRPLLFAVRYVFFGPPRPSDLTRQELENILSGPLGLLVVGHPRLPKNNTLDAALGLLDAEWLVKNSIAAGYDPSQITAIDGGPPELAIDMEGVKNPGPLSAAYARAACNYIRDHGFRPRVYVGYDPGLTNADLAALPGDPSFWCDAAALSQRPVPPMPYSLKQHTQITHCGIEIDPDEALGDVYGVIYEQVANDQVANDGDDENDIHYGDTDPAIPNPLPNTTTHALEAVTAPA